MFTLLLLFVHNMHIFLTDQFKTDHTFHGTVRLLCFSVTHVKHTGMSSNALSAVLEKQMTDGAGIEETDTFLDLLSCPHSPWSLNLEALKLQLWDIWLIFGYFTKLTIVDKNVSASVFFPPKCCILNPIQTTASLLLTYAGPNPLFKNKYWALEWYYLNKSSESAFM